MSRKIVDFKPVSLVTVKKILSERKKDGELTFEQKVSLDYAKEFGKGKESAVEKAIKEITEMGVDDATAVKIVNVLPETELEVRLIFEKLRFDLKEDSIKKILEISKSLE